MRNHGWELPYHPLQMVAISVFLALAFSFYVFFSPFVGSTIAKYHVIAAYSPVVATVFILYVRCAACNPADPGLQRSKQFGQGKEMAPSKSKSSKGSPMSDTNLELSRDESDKSLKAILASTEKSEAHVAGNTCSVFERWLPGAKLIRNACCKRRQEPGRFNPGELLLYCSICEAEISKCSKHCRACDKCVHGFDHHCRWLNNCVGKKNYRTFVALMVSCLLLLILQWATGIVVLVRCFSEKQSFVMEIEAKLGSSFSRVPYIVVVGLLTLLAMVATVPLAQLFFFHLILIKKGLSTYDYILAVREKDLGFWEGGGLNSLTTSPASSTDTGFSGYSSAGALALHQGILCTPPRIFVEQEQGILGLSSDLEVGGGRASKGGRGALQTRASVGINPWKLARLNAEDATRAAAHAREMSSNVRPSRYSLASLVTDTEESSYPSSRSASGEIAIAGSRRGCMKHEHLSRKEGWLMMRERRDRRFPLNVTDSIAGLGFPRTTMAPLPLEARSTFRCSPSRFSGDLRASYPEYSYPASRFSGDLRASYPGSSYPGSHVASPDACLDSTQLRVSNPVFFSSSPSASCDPAQVLLRMSASDGYEASGGESGDENNEQGQQLSRSWSKFSLKPALINSTGKAVARVGHPMISRADFSCSAGGSRAEANILKHVQKEWPELRDGLSRSTDNSHSSSPTHCTSPLRDSSEFQSMADKTSCSATPERTRSISWYYDGPFSSIASKASSGKRGLPSTRKLRDSILGFKLGMPPTRSHTGLLESVP